MDGERADGFGEAAVGEYRRVDAADEGAQGLQGLRGHQLGGVHQLRGLIGVLRERPADHAEP